MKPRILLAAILACAATLAQAQMSAPSQPIVTVTASATTTVANDRLQAWLRAEADNASASAAANQVNAAIAKALADAKAYPSVKVATAGYATYQVGEKPAAQRWRVVQTITLESGDFTAAANLITRLQDEDKLLLSGMGFTLSEKARRAAEDSVTQRAIRGWQQRAQEAAHGLGFAAWRPGRVTVQTGEPSRVYPMLRAQALGAPAAPVQVEAGTTEVNVTVSGEAVLEQSRAIAR
jgi:predicted secreted protein